MVGTGYPLQDPSEPHYLVLDAGTLTDVSPDAVKLAEANAPGLMASVQDGPAAAMKQDVAAATDAYGGGDYPLSLEYARSPAATDQDLTVAVVARTNSGGAALIAHGMADVVAHVTEIGVRLVE